MKLVLAALILAGCTRRISVEHHVINRMTWRAILTDSADCVSPCETYLILTTTRGIDDAMSELCKGFVCIGPESGGSVFILYRRRK